MDFGNVNNALGFVQSYEASARIPAAVSLKMLDNSMEQSQEMGDAVVKMMEQSVYPHLGGNIDVSV